MLGILRTARIMVSFYRRQRQAVENSLVQKRIILLPVVKIIDLIPQGNQKTGIREMVFDFVQQSVPVVLLFVHLFHRLSDLSVSHSRKAEGIRKGRRCVSIYRRYHIAASHLILILRLRQKPRYRCTIDIIPGSNRRRR